MMRVLWVAGVSGAALVLAAASPSAAFTVSSPRDVIAACEAPIFDRTGNFTEDFKKLAPQERASSSARYWECDRFVRAAETEFCPMSAQEAFRLAAVSAARSPALARLPLDVFVQYVAVMVPGCSLRTCPSDRVTYRSADGQHSFEVSGTARGTSTQPFTGGHLTTVMKVLKGRSDGRPLYIYMESYIRNTGKQSPGTQPPVVASWTAEPLGSRYKLASGPWPVRFYKDSPGLPVQWWAREQKGPVGGWVYAECRGGTVCPKGWAGSCDGPSPAMAQKAPP